MQVRLLRSATDDIIEAANFYDEQLPGLGDYFTTEVFREIRSLRLYGGIHAKRSDSHCCLAPRFPYAIYYDVIDEAIRVHSVLDCRRASSWIRKQLQRPRV